MYIKVILSFIFLFTISVLVIALFFLRTSLDLKNNGVKTTATVTEIINAKGKGIKGSGGGIYYKYEFISTDSIKYQGLNTNHIYLEKSIL